METPPDSEGRSLRMQHTYWTRSAQNYVYLELFGAIKLAKDRQTKEPLSEYNITGKRMERVKAEWIAARCMDAYCQ